MIDLKVEPEWWTSRLAIDDRRVREHIQTVLRRELPDSILAIAPSWADPHFSAELFVPHAPGGDVALDAMPWSWATNQFDAVVCTDTIEYLHDAGAALKELARIAPVRIVALPVKPQPGHRWLFKVQDAWNLPGTVKFHLLRDGEILLAISKEAA